MRAPNSGSPPRMRGKPQAQRSSLSERRITPAHAGKTQSIKSFHFLSTDHPRACGENAGGFTGADAINGSPPRMRGKQVFYKESDLVGRITPAHAGKTFGITKITGLESDHPRACGENASNAINSAVGFGSPPRMRGKPSHLLFSSRSRRITPAHAGKTLRKCYISEVNPHPILQFPLTSHKVVVSSGNPTKLCEILLYQTESILLKLGVYSPVHSPAFASQGLTCQL